MSAGFNDNDLLFSNTSRGNHDDNESDSSGSSVSEVGIGLMTRQKKEINNQMAGAVKEIEQLRSRQHELEMERKTLESIALGQEEYENGKKEIIDKLNKSCILIEKEEVQATRMVALLSETRERFKGILAELNAIKEDLWSDEAFEIELNRAIVKVDIARNDYKKALARIDASSWHKSLIGEKPSSIVDGLASISGEDKSFGYWLKVGIAVTLPLIVVGSIMYVVHLYLMGLL